MSTSSTVYLLGGTEIEKQRLLAQVRPYEPMARELLERVQVKSGWRVADIGCGPIGILNLLSEAVGPEGQVFGVEREARFAAMAREEAARHHLQNVSSHPEIVNWGVVDVAFIDQAVDGLDLVDDAGRGVAEEASSDRLFRVVDADV